MSTIKHRFIIVSSLVCILGGALTPVADPRAGSRAVETLEMGLCGGNLEMGLCSRDLERGLCRRNALKGLCSRSLERGCAVESRIPVYRGLALLST